MSSTSPEPFAPSLATLTLRQLLGRAGDSVGRLVTAEVRLARAEAEEDLKAALNSARDAAIAGVAALIAVNAALVALILALSTVLAPPIAALVVAAPFFLAAGIFYMKFRRAKLLPPLKATRETLEEDVKWIRSMGKP